MKRIMITLALISMVIFAPTRMAGAEGISHPVLVNMSYIYGGTVVNVQHHVNVRAEPNVHSAIVATAPIGARLSLRYFGNQEWWEVLSINGETYGARAGEGIGYVNAKFVKTN